MTCRYDLQSFVYIGPGWFRHRPRIAVSASPVKICLVFGQVKSPFHFNESEI